MKNKGITQEFINDLVKHAIETEISTGAFMMNATVTDFAKDNDLEGYEEEIEAAFEANGIEVNYQNR